MCYETATIANPNDGTTGAECPVGSFCVAGSAASLVCADGTKSTATQAASCTNCAKGFYCTGSTEFS